jgi:hypothetical protein
MTDIMFTTPTIAKDSKRAVKIKVTKDMVIEKTKKKFKNVRSVKTVA